MTNIYDKSKFLSGKAITEMHPKAEIISPTNGIIALVFLFVVIGGISAANIPRGIAAIDLNGPPGHAKTDNKKNPKNDITLADASIT